MTPADLKREFARARLARQRHRDIAAALNVSEGALVAAHIGAQDESESPLAARRLRGPWHELIAGLEPLGELLALTRNDSCVHEKTGVYSGADGSETIGLVLGGAIDLRVFYTRWAHGFAVSERAADGPLQRSLQFYDAHGTAVHKVFVRAGTDLAAYQALVERHASDDAGTTLAPAPAESPTTESPDSDIDVAGFRAGWASLRDTHEFFALLRTFGVTRTQGLRLAAPGYAERVDNASAHQLLATAAQQGVPIMVFVGNPGMIQIHSGPVHKLAVTGPWINVLDPGFSLHLREDHIAHSWLVRKPTTDGLVSSLELYDAEDRTIAMFFGERKSGHAERCDWRELLAGVAGESEACAS